MANGGVGASGGLAVGAIVLVAVLVHAGNDWLIARLAASITEIGQ